MGEFFLNELFEQKAKVYQSKPVRAMKYEKGMETGFVVYFTNIETKNIKAYTHEGMKFFDTEAEAWDYINSNPDQYINVNGQLVQIDVAYEEPVPILHRKINNPDERIGYICSHEGKYAFVSNESEQYDFFYLDADYCSIPIWIIQDADGRVRVWSSDYDEETFFGKENELVCEKISENEYVQVEV